MIESEFILGGFEAVLDGPAVSYDGNERLDGCSGQAPGREECEVAISDIAVDQEPARPERRAGLIIFGSIEIGEFEVGPVVQPCSFRPFARRWSYRDPAEKPRTWDCQKFRVWAGIMGKKETHYVTTQRAYDTQ